MVTFYMGLHLQVGTQINHNTQYFVTFHGLLASSFAKVRAESLPQTALGYSETVFGMTAQSPQLTSDSREALKCINIKLGIYTHTHTFSYSFISTNG